MVLRWLLVASLTVSLGSAGCGDGEEPTPKSEPQGLSPREVLIRASIDVRGIRPTSDELARIEEDEGALPEMLDELLYHPGFGARIGTIYADALQLRRDRLLNTPNADSYGLADRRGELEQAVVEEAVHLVSWIVMADRPFSEVVTSNLVVAEPILREPYLLQWEPEQPEGLPAGTKLGRYKYARPAGGVLASNSFALRYNTTLANAQRGRANAITRAFLCVDFLARPIDLPESFSLADPDAIEHAVRTDASCQSCHVTLDPIASHFWGLSTLGIGESTEKKYVPEEEALWAETTGVAPGYFGATSSNGVGALGAAIAADGRFASCAARHVYEDFLGRDATLADEGQLAIHQEAFVRSGLSMRALVRSILDDPAYRGRRERSERGGDPEPVEHKLLVPEQLDSALFDLTGHRLTFDGRSALRIDDGVRSITGADRSGPTRTPIAGYALVHRRLAEAAAQSLLLGHAPESRVGGLLASMDLSQAPTKADVSRLVHEILSLPSLDRAEVDALTTLWSDVAATTGDTAEAWTALVAALLADPRFAMY